MRLGVRNALVEQPGIQLRIALAAHARREEAFPHQPDLILDLSLLPSGCRGARHRVDEVVTAHLQDAEGVE